MGNNQTSYPANPVHYEKMLERQKTAVMLRTKSRKAPAPPFRSLKVKGYYGSEHASNIDIPTYLQASLPRKMSPRCGSSIGSRSSPDTVRYGSTIGSRSSSDAVRGFGGTTMYLEGSVSDGDFDSSIHSFPSHVITSSRRELHPSVSGIPNSPDPDYRTAVTSQSQSTTLNNTQNTLVAADMSKNRPGCSHSLPRYKLSTSTVPSPTETPSSGHNLSRRLSTASSVTTLKRKNRRAPQPPQSMPATPFMSARSGNNIRQIQVIRKQSLTSMYSSTSSEQALGPKKRRAPTPPKMTSSISIQTDTSHMDESDEESPFTTHNIDVQLHYTPRSKVAIPPPDYDGVGGVGTIVEAEVEESMRESMLESKTGIDTKLDDSKDQDIDGGRNSNEDEECKVLTNKMNTHLQDEIKQFVRNASFKNKNVKLLPRPKSPEEKFKEDLEKKITERKQRQENGDILILETRDDQSDKESKMSVEHRSEGSGASNPTPPVRQKRHQHGMEANWVPADDLLGDRDDSEDFYLANSPVTGFGRKGDIQTKSKKNKSKKRSEKLGTSSLRYLRKSIQSAFESISRSASKKHKRSSISNAFKLEKSLNLPQSGLASDEEDEGEGHLKFKAVHIKLDDNEENEPKTTDAEQELERLKQVEKKYLKLKQQKPSQNSESDAEDKARYILHGPFYKRNSPQGEEDEVFDSSDGDDMDTEKIQDIKLAKGQGIQTKRSKSETVLCRRKSNPVYESEGENTGEATAEKDNVPRSTAIEVPPPPVVSYTQNGSQHVIHAPTMINPMAPVNPFIMQPPISTPTLYNYPHHPFVHHNTVPLPVYPQHMSAVPQSHMLTSQAYLTNPSLPMPFQMYGQMGNSAIPMVQPHMVPIPSTFGVGSAIQNQTVQPVAGQPSTNYSHSHSQVAETLASVNINSTTTKVDVEKEHVGKCAEANEAVVSRPPETNLTADEKDTVDSAKLDTTTRRDGNDNSESLGENTEGSDQNIAEETVHVEKLSIDVEVSLSEEQQVPVCTDEVDDKENIEPPVDGDVDNITEGNNQKNTDMDDIKPAVEADDDDVGKQTNDHDEPATIYPSYILERKKERTEQDLLKSQIKLLSARGYKPMNWKPMGVRALIGKDENGN